MSASDLAFSSPSSTEWKESDPYEAAVTELKAVRDQSVQSPEAVRSRRSSLDMVKREVKAPTARRSGLLAAQLRSEPSESALSPKPLRDGAASSSKRKGKIETVGPLATVDEASPASLESASSTVQLPTSTSPSSGLSSPLAVPSKRQHTSNWAALDDDDFVPPHILAAQTLPSNFIYAEDSRPGSVMDGVGRKLKGSDAARFRQSVMRQTGFLEPQSTSRPLTG